MYLNAYSVGILSNHGFGIFPHTIELICILKSRACMGLLVHETDVYSLIVELPIWPHLWLCNLSHPSKYINHISCGWTFYLNFPQVVSEVRWVHSSTVLSGVVCKWIGFPHASINSVNEGYVDIMVTIPYIPYIVSGVGSILIWCHMAVYALCI